MAVSKSRAFLTSCFFETHTRMIPVGVSNNRRDNLGHFLFIRSTETENARRNAHFDTWIQCPHRVCVHSWQAITRGVQSTPVCSAYGKDCCCWQEVALCPTGSTLCLHLTLNRGLAFCHHFLLLSFHTLGEQFNQKGTKLPHVLSTAPQEGAWCGIPISTCSLNSLKLCEPVFIAVESDKTDIHCYTLHTVVQTHKRVGVVFIWGQRTVTFMVSIPSCCVSSQIVGSRQRAGHEMILVSGVFWTKITMDVKDMEGKNKPGFSIFHLKIFSVQWRVRVVLLHLQATDWSAAYSSHWSGLATTSL